MEVRLYSTMLLLAAGVNLIIAFALLHNNMWFRTYDVYRRSRTLMALNYAIFAVGFILHAHYQLRLSLPAVADALTVSYFHSGAVLFGWSHISLMRPNYLTRSIVIRDLTLLIVGLVCYWTPFLIGQSSLHLTNLLFLVFFVHATLVASTFYYIYYKVRHSIEQLPAGGDMPSWWTPDTKRTVLGSYHSFVLGCHLIVIFGLGSVALTAAFPSAIWPYIVLSLSGIVVFSYIFYSIVEYGNVIDSATNAAEDVEVHK